DVAEDDAAVRAEAFECAEPDQSGAAAHVEDHVAGTQIGAVEDTVAVGRQVGGVSGPQGGTVTVPAGQKPLGPRVFRRHPATVAPKRCAAAYASMSPVPLSRAVV